ncbi:MAG: cytochrome c1 [Pseudomonadota bacterium]
MLKNSIIAALTALALAPVAALAAGAAGKTTDVGFSFEGPFGTYDKHQLQRGFEVFQKVCAGCHGLKYLAFRDLGRADGPAFPEEQIKAIAAEYTIIDPDHEDGERPGLPSDLFPANDGAGAPDLTLMAKARAGFHGPSGLMINQFFRGIGGPEYIYSILMGYNDQDEEVAGNTLYGNDAMAGGLISMAPPLYEDVADDYDIVYTAYNADGTEVEAKEGDDDHHNDGHEYHAPEPTQEQMAEDVAAFLMFAAEPAMTERKEAGFRNLVWLILLAVLLYYTNKKLWAPIKRKET